MAYKDKASYGSLPPCILYSKARDEYHELYHEPYHQLHYISITTCSIYIPPRRCVSYTSRHVMNITNSITNPTTNSIMEVSRSLHIYTTLSMCIKTRDEYHEYHEPYRELYSISITTSSTYLPPRRCASYIQQDTWWISRTLGHTYHTLSHPRRFWSNVLKHMMRITNSKMQSDIHTYAYEYSYCAHTSTRRYVHTYGQVYTLQHTTHSTTHDEDHELYDAIWHAYLYVRIQLLYRYINTLICTHIWIYICVLCNTLQTVKHMMRITQTMMQFDTHLYVQTHLLCTYINTPICTHIWICIYTTTHNTQSNTWWASRTRWCDPIYTLIRTNTSIVHIHQHANMHTHIDIHIHTLQYTPNSKTHDEDHANYDAIWHTPVCTNTSIVQLLIICFTVCSAL